MPQTYVDKTTKPKPRPVRVPVYPKGLVPRSQLARLREEAKR